MSPNNPAGAQRRYARRNSRSKRWWHSRQRRSGRQQTLVATLDLLQSPELHRRVAQASHLSLTADEIAGQCRIHTNSTSDPITIVLRRRNPAEAVELANLYARETVRLSTEQQRDE